MALSNVFARLSGGQLSNFSKQVTSGVGEKQAAVSVEHDVCTFDREQRLSTEDAPPAQSTPLSGGLTPPVDASLALRTGNRTGFTDALRTYFSAADPVALARQQGIDELAAAHAAVVDPHLAPLQRHAALTDFLGKAEGNTARVRALVLPERPEQAPLAKAARTLLEVPTVNNALGFQMLANLLVPFMLQAMDGLSFTELECQLRPALAASAAAVAAAHASAVSNVDSVPRDFLAALAADKHLCMLLAASSEAHHTVYGSGYLELFRLHSSDPIGEAVELARDFVAPTSIGRLAETADLPAFPDLADALAALEAETAILMLSHIAGIELPGGMGPGRRSLSALLVEVCTACEAARQSFVAETNDRVQALLGVARLLLLVNDGAAAQLRLLVQLKQRFACSRDF